jgi:hypothetical protein
VTAFDPSTQLAQVEVGIRYFVNGEPTTLPPIESVPVCFPGDGTWYLWHQITPGETEGLIHFSQRAIDTWIDQGGPVAPHERRILSADDAFFAPGYRSRPGAIPNFRNDGAGISDYSGSTYIHLTSGGSEIENNVDITGDVTVTGNYDITGDVTTVGDYDITGVVEVEGDTTLTGALSVTGNTESATYSTGGAPGVTGTFTSADSPSKTITVTNGIITAIA